MAFHLTRHTTLGVSVLTPPPPLCPSEVGLVHAAALPAYYPARHWLSAVTLSEEKTEHHRWMDE